MFDRIKFVETWCCTNYVITVFCFKNKTKKKFQNFILQIRKSHILIFSFKVQYMCWLKYLTCYSNTKHFLCFINVTNLVHSFCVLSIQKKGMMSEVNETYTQVLLLFSFTFCLFVCPQLSGHIKLKFNVVCSKLWQIKSKLNQKVSLNRTECNSQLNDVCTCVLGTQLYSLKTFTFSTLMLFFIEIAIINLTISYKLESDPIIFRNSNRITFFVSNILI